VNLGTRLAHVNALLGAGISHLTGASHPFDKAYENIAIRAA
jgi:hypothetical protein